MKKPFFQARVSFAPSTKGDPIRKRWLSPVRGKEIICGKISTEREEAWPMVHDQRPRSVVEYGVGTRV